MLNKHAPTVSGDVITIRITTRSGTEIAYIDAQDLEIAQGITKSWGIFKDAKGKKSLRAGKDDGQVFLHKLIYDTKQGERLEFINDNSLDLRRENVNKVLKSGEVIPMYVAPPVEEKPKKAAKKKDPNSTYEAVKEASDQGLPAAEKVMQQLGEKPQSSVPGVKYHKASKKWTARIYWKGKRHSLGYFKEREAAEKQAAIFRAEGPDSPNLKRNQPKGA